MQPKWMVPTIAVLVISFAAIACGGNSPGVDQKVQTAIAQTATYQAVVNQAAHSTVQALPPTATPGAPVDYYSMSE